MATDYKSIPIPIIQQQIVAEIETMLYEDLLESFKAKAIPLIKEAIKKLEVRDMQYMHDCLTMRDILSLRIHIHE